jgi:hypothetical protein
MSLSQGEYIMGSPLNLIGENVQLRIVKDGALQKQFTDIKRSSVKFKRKILEDEYLGQSDIKTRMIRNGCEGRLEDMTTTQGDWLDLNDMIDDKAEGKSSVEFALAMVFNYASGDKERVIFTNISFGDLDVSMGSKSENVTKSIDWKCGKRPSRA